MREGGLASATVYDAARPHPVVPRLSDEGPNFQGRTARRDDIFDDDKPRSRRVRKTPELHRAVFPFCEVEGHGKLPSDFVSDDQAAECGGKNRFGFKRSEFLGKQDSRISRVPRDAQKQGALHVVTAMKTRGQSEVSFQECSRLPHHGVQSFIYRCFLQRNPSSICPKMEETASFGFSACMMGRPTTR